VFPAIVTAVSLVVAAGVACADDDSTASSAAVEPAHFHHVQLNVTDPGKSLRYYRRVFGAVPVKFRGATDALFTERSFLLFNKVDSPPNPALNTGIWHIGWGGVDIQGEYQWWKNHDVEFHTTPQPLPGRDNFYMYLYGPDKELIEINTMGHHRFAHVHFFASDVNLAVAWYAKHLGLKPRALSVPRPTGDPNTLGGIWMNVIQCDNVTMIFFGKPDQEPAPRWWPDAPLKELQSTKDRPIERIGFSYPQIEPVFARMQAAGATIVEPITMRDQWRLKSFVVEGPDRVLIEVAEAKPIPEGAWDQRP
jgi:catechol 2,3-dioxygenase-like lactoylglutathione lyase family enzyme